MTSTWSTLCILSVLHVCLIGACPCEHLVADPLFPGGHNGGMRIDCEFHEHGLTEIPTDCFALYPDVSQVFLDFNEITTVNVDSFNGLNNLKTLVLKKNKISSCHDDAFAELHQLEFLDLTSNKLGNAPASVWNLSNLTKLSLADNNIKDSSSFNIPNLFNLKWLDLHLNHLEHIPTGSFDLLSHLQILIIKWNILQEMPDLTKNLALTEVIANGNAITKFPKHVFSSNLTSPITYHIVDNPAWDLPASMLLDLPWHSHIVTDNDEEIWCLDESEKEDLLSRSWTIQDGMGRYLYLEQLVRVCGLDGMPDPCT
ncbi:unnamed protein product [Meganyctiphanes norvegica]|uniref:Uncharacterized protein n=1 Tax=Meganyctiphanes norvegica TaxID=48144 RepID=A0AAV2PTN8_MEGNR